VWSEYLVAGRLWTSSLLRTGQQTARSLAEPVLDPLVALALRLPQDAGRAMRGRREDEDASGKPRKRR